MTNEGKGFGKSKPPKGKQHREKSHPLQKFVFEYVSSDGYRNILKIEETSPERAAHQFSIFISDLEQCLSLVAQKGED